MKYLKSLGKSLAYSFIIIAASIFIITIFSYFDIISPNAVKILKLLSIITSVFVGGFIIGKINNKKSYIEGMKLSFIIVFILLALSLVLKSANINSILYYIILVISTIFGSMIGALKKIKN